MFQGLKELSAAKGRTLLITVTVGLIAILVSFLSALTAGLGHQSVSALRELAGEDNLILADSGSTTLSASTLTQEQVDSLVSSDARLLWQVRDRVGDSPVMLLNNSSLKPGEISIPASLDPTSTASQYHATAVVDTANDVYLDHLPVVEMNTSDLSALAQVRGVQGPAGAFLADTSSAPSGTVALSGSERWNASASYQGEQTSLNLMIVMLYIISALVLGAFFTVWTIQRLRGIAISSALGAARRVLIADALGQAVIVLVVGIVAGTLFTVATAVGIGETLPVVIDPTTTLLPALILATAGLLGAAISLGPILRVEPRSALMTA